MAGNEGSPTQWVEIKEALLINTFKKIYSGTSEYLLNTVISWASLSLGFFYLILIIFASDMLEYIKN